MTKTTKTTTAGDCDDDPFRTPDEYRHISTTARVFKVIRIPLFVAFPTTASPPSTFHRRGLRPRLDYPANKRLAPGALETTGLAGTMGR